MTERATHWPPKSALDGAPTALDELISISRLRSKAHEEANLFRDMHVTAAESNNHPLRHELAGARGVLARWAVMAAHQEFRTVDLARIENRGDWDATTGIEKQISELTRELFATDQLDGLVDRHSPEAKRRITIDPTIVAATGLLVVRRKRLMLATAPQEMQFDDKRPGQKNGFSRSSVTGTAHLEVDKVSEFLLDPASLSEVDEEAAYAVYELSAFGKPFEITKGEQTPPEVIEYAIDQRHRSLIPAVTIYYADRKYNDLRPLNREDESAGAAL